MMRVPRKFDAFNSASTGMHTIMYSAIRITTNHISTSNIVVHRRVGPIIIFILVHNIIRVIRPRKSRANVMHHTGLPIHFA